MNELEPVTNKEIEKLEEENLVIEGQIVELDEDLTELFKEKQRLQELIDEVAKKIRSKQSNRWNLGVLKRQMDTKIQDERDKETERQRYVKLQEQESQSFERMRELAFYENFPWVPFVKKHQWEAALKIAQYGSCLLNDEMGLGKSLEVIAAADLMKAKKIAVFAPANVVMSLLDEFRMWAPHRHNIVPMKSADKKMKEMMTPLIGNAEEIVILMNFESLWGRGSYNTEFITALERADFDLVIVDEAHSAKNEDGRTFAFLEKLRRNSHTKFVPMSGTFLLNSPEDLWTNLYLIDPERFYDKNSYLRQYCQQDWETGKWLFKSGGAKSLITQLQGRIISRKLAEVAREDPSMQLPEQHINEVLIPFEEVPFSQQEVMFQLSAHAQLVIEESGESMSIAAQIALITRQRQASVWPAAIKLIQCDKDDFGNDIKGTEKVVFDASKMCQESIKFEYAVRLLKKQIAEGRRCVVFSQFKMDALEKRLADEGIAVCRYDGDTPDPKRQEIKKDFLRPAAGMAKREDYKWDVVIANFKTGGVGLTFTEATYMLLLDEEWNPGKNEQAYKRIHRIGQTEETYIDILRMEQHPGTIDMWMRDLNAFKKAMIDGLEDAIENIKPVYEISDVFKTGYSEITT